MPRDFSRAVRHPNREVIEGARLVTRADLQHSGLVPLSLPGVPAERVNQEVLDENGELAARWHFMLDVDTDGDPRTYITPEPGRWNWYRN